MPEKRKGPKQVWAVGNTVRLGGREYIIVGEEPPRAKGEAKVWVLDSPDHTKTYHWIARRGLHLIRGDLVRPGRAARRKAAAAAARAAKAQELAAARGARMVAHPTPVGEQPSAERVGLMRRLLARLRPGVKPSAIEQKQASHEAPSRPIQARARG